MKQFLLIAFLFLSLNAKSFAATFPFNTDAQPGEKVATSEQRALFIQGMAEICKRHGILMPEAFIRDLTDPASANYHFLQSQVIAVVGKGRMNRYGNYFPPQTDPTGFSVGNFITALMVMPLMDGTHAKLGAISRDGNKVKVAFDLNGSSLEFNFIDYPGKLGVWGSANVDSIYLNGESVDNLVAFDVYVKPQLFDLDANDSSLAAEKHQLLEDLSKKYLTDDTQSLKQDSNTTVLH